MDRVYSLSVYETPTHFYIIGSDATESRFRTLKIDRITQNEFIVGEPNHDYSKADIGELLATVSSSSIVTPTEKWGRKRNSTVSTGGLLRTLEKACGLIGAVRFLHGYYLLLVSKAKQICQIGNHSIFKVEDVSMIYLPSTTTPLSPEEQRYAKLFQTVDFTTNFYFSYTYQLSRTLQENCLAEKGIKWNKNNYNFNMKSEQKFVWNDFLLEPFRKSQVNKKWYLELVHGYIGHQLVELPCAKFDLILLARRSAEFAGTRFLKRGTNYNGAVANDVETEQIVWEVSNARNLNFGKFSAFVQRRGSVPLFWSQDSMLRGTPMVVGKPPIVIDRVEPNALTTAIHFRDLRRKYGHPIIVLNLVKRMEQKHNENLLHDIFSKTIQYLNQFRHPGHCIDYISFDVSRCNKTGRVLQQLDRLGQRVVLATGWFQNFPSLKFRDPSNLNSIPLGAEDIIYRFEPEMSSDGRMLLQHGIVRSNCVDCLDRTNVAQFGLGKAALCWQLFSMGLLESPSPQSLNNEFCRSFEELYDEHGDTLAWQYAGSQLVHSIKTYKRTAVFQERSRDVLQTLSRYYSNTFSDFEKQDGINLFLGTFRVQEDRPPIWTLGSDHYLHFPITSPKSNEFLRWSISVSSDNEDEDWLADPDFRDWVILKSATQFNENDIRFDNNWVNVSINNMEILSTKNEENFSNFDDYLFSITHRTFEFTSLEQLLRLQQQMQQRRPLVLDSLRQSQQGGGSFMWMFKSEHSPSPPPALSFTSPSDRRKFSINRQLTTNTTTTFSSLAAGTASILRKEEIKEKIKIKKSFVDEEGQKPLLIFDENELAEEADEQKVEDQSVGDEQSGGEGTLLLMALDGQNENNQNIIGNQKEEGLAIFSAVEAEEKTFESDVIILEDKNAPEEFENDPLNKFKVLLNYQITQTPKIQKQPFGINTGLKSPREVYFGIKSRRKSIGGGYRGLLAISDGDMALYSRYSMDNLRRQRQPTAWKLPNPLKNLQKSSTTITPPPSQQQQLKFSSQNSSRSAPPKQQRKTSSNQQKHFSSNRSSPTNKIYPQSQSSPFRKDFYRLGPAFEFKPSNFSKNGVFSTELAQISDESMFIYKKTVEDNLKENLKNI